MQGEINDATAMRRLTASIERTMTRTEAIAILASTTHAESGLMKRKAFKAERERAGEAQEGW